MKNGGGITYFESALLYNPETSSSRRSRRSTKSSPMKSHNQCSETSSRWPGGILLAERRFCLMRCSKCSAKSNPEWEVWLARDFPRDPSAASEAQRKRPWKAMPAPPRIRFNSLATEAEANSAFDEITYKKSHRSSACLESFSWEEVFRDGIRKYTARTSFRNHDRGIFGMHLARPGKPVVEIAANWTEQPGFPVVKSRA